MSTTDAAAAARARAAAKIKLLSERTTANGCTEAEAMAAAAKVSELCAEYGVTLSDVQVGEEICLQGYIGTGNRSAHEVRYCAQAIANLVDCKVWESRFPDAGLTYFGLPHDVELAKFLTDTIKGAMDREAAGYLMRCRQVGAPAHRTGAFSFLMGMASRVNERLRDLKAAQRNAAVVTTGRDLVVVKGAVVEAQFRATGVTLRKGGGSRGNVRDGSAYHAGRAAGDRVGLGRPIAGGGSGPALIGAR